VLEDIFAVQEELTQSIVRAIAPQILDAETEKIHRRRPDDLNAYEIAVRANAKASEAWLKSDAGLRDQAIASMRPLPARRSYELNPHSMASVTALSFIEIAWGDADSAVVHLLEALRLSPRDPQRPIVFLNLAMASECAGRYADGVDHATLGLREAPGFAPLHAHLAVNYVGLGAIDRARAALAESTRIASGRSSARWRGSCSAGPSTSGAARRSCASPPV
jgi:predicted Zn-dependent protease